MKKIISVSSGVGEISVTLKNNVRVDKIKLLNFNIANLFENVGLDNNKIIWQFGNVQQNVTVLEYFIPVGYYDIFTLGQKIKNDNNFIISFTVSGNKLSFNFDVITSINVNSGAYRMLGGGFTDNFYEISQASFNWSGLNPVNLLQKNIVLIFQNLDISMVLSTDSNRVIIPNNSKFNEIMNYDFRGWSFSGNKNLINNIDLILKYNGQIYNLPDGFYWNLSFVVSYI